MKEKYCGEEGNGCNSEKIFMCSSRSKLLDANNCSKYKISVRESYGLNACVPSNST